MAIGWRGPSVDWTCAPYAVRILGLSDDAEVRLIRLQGDPGRSCQRKGAAVFVKHCAARLQSSTFDPGSPACDDVPFSDPGRA